MLTNLPLGVDYQEKKKEKGPNKNSLESASRAPGDSGI
jgi:hypothetical protein